MTVKGHGGNATIGVGKLIHYGALRATQYDPDAIAKETPYLEGIDGREMINQLQHLEPLPDVCIVNVKMPLINGFETTRQLCKQFGFVKILAYSMSSYDRDIIGMLSSGANGYLIKNGDIDELIRAIIAIQERGIYLNEEVSKIILAWLRRTGN